MTVEDVLAASDDAAVESIMDPGAPIVAPGTDQEVAAWHAVKHWESALSAGAMLAADIVGALEAQLQVNILFAFFVPGIVYLADAVGTQTETIVVRGLSLGVPIRKMVSRELLAGFAIGAALAMIAGPLVWWRWGDPDVALAVGVSVLAACSTATVAAMALPWLFEKIGFDPAFGSGPLATVVQDLLSIWIYLSITTLVAS